MPRRGNKTPESDDHAAAERVLERFVSDCDLDRINGETSMQFGELSEFVGTQESETQILPEPQEQAKPCESATQTEPEVAEEDDGEGSDFVYDEDEQPALESAPQPVPAKIHRGASYYSHDRSARIWSPSLHAFASKTTPSEMRSWVDEATDKDLVSLVHGLRELHDSWLQADARLINLEVELKLAEQARQSTLLASEICAAAGRRSRASSSEGVEGGGGGGTSAELAALRVALAEKDTQLEQQAATASQLQAQLDSRQEALAAKEAEAEQLTDQLQALILQHKGATEATRHWRGRVKT